tara:strand:+ start:357 stop:1406 length:1050 start_codon:yes stop_codon:yes gene_type:complete
MNNSYLIPFSAFNALPTKKSVSSDADTFFESWNNRPFQLRQFLTELEKVDGFGDILLGNSPAEDREAFLNLLIIEDKIRNEELFWSLFGYLFSLTDLNSVYIENIIEMVKRYDRHKVHLNKKQQWANQIYNVPTGRDNTKVRGILDKYNRDTDITVYRGFLVRKDTGEQIRESNDKNSDEYLNQKTGLGLSYSVNKDVAIAFATRWTSMKLVANMLRLGESKFANFNEELSKIGILNWEETPISRFVELIQENSDSVVIETFQELIKNGLENRKERYEEFDSSYMNFGVRSVLGTYKVKKIDILMPINLSNQNEFVILPENAKLIRYDFLTSKQIYDAKGIHDFKENKT